MLVKALRERLEPAKDDSVDEAAVSDASLFAVMVREYDPFTDPAMGLDAPSSSSSVGVMVSLEMRSQPSPLGGLKLELRSRSIQGTKPFSKKIPTMRVSGQSRGF